MLWHMSPNAKDCIRSGAKRNSGYNLVERSRFKIAMGIQSSDSVLTNLFNPL